MSLLLSHNAKPDLAEKHGLSPEDIARESGHANVLTVLRQWKQSEQAEGTTFRHSPDNADTFSLAPSTSSLRLSPTRRLQSNHISTKELRSVAANNSAGGNGKKLLTKPSLESISNKGKKLAKAASNPNLAAFLSGHSSFTPSTPSPPTLAPNFPAPAPLTLRQNPSSSTMTHRQTTLPSPTHPLMHHIINTDKARRPSLPSVFEKAAHPSQSFKSALGMTPTGASFAKSRSISSNHGEGSINDPYHIGRSNRSGSKTSLSSVFRTAHSSRDRIIRSDPLSQPLSPAASSFFTADDEIEEAERDAFLRMDQEISSGEETYQHHSSQDHFKEPYLPKRNIPLDRRASAEGLHGRDRAGSTSSAATSASRRSVSARGYNAPSMNGSASLAFPITAPPTQSIFFPREPSPSSDGDAANLPSSTSKPSLATVSSPDSLVIPHPIPPPPSSSTQPFFTKAAISAAHINIASSRPGFFRPRKSSNLSNSRTDVGSYLSSPDLEHMPRQFQHSAPEEALYHETINGNQEEDEESIPFTGPSVIIRRPTVRENNNDSHAGYTLHKQSPPSPVSPANGENAASSLPVSPMTLSRASSSTVNANVYRHSRALSDGTGTLRTSPSSHTLPDLLTHANLDYRQSRTSHLQSLGSGENLLDQELDPETAGESHDTFPTDQERPFVTRPRAASRARMDSVGSSTSSIPYNGTQTSPNMQTAIACAPGQQQGHEMEASWSHLTRPSRSGSTGTDTRTSRSGSTGEAPGHLPKFFGFDYSSSPGEYNEYALYSSVFIHIYLIAASSTYFNYQPSNSTTATSLISSPPGTAAGTASFHSQSLSEGKGTTFTHAEARSIVKKKEEELLQFDATTTPDDRSISQGPTLSQQLAAYGESLSIERELSRAEKERRFPDPEIFITIPEPPPIAKYSWEILGKETRTTVPLTAGQRAKDHDSGPSVHQRLWTHKMVSPFEVPLPRPGNNASGHRHTASSGTNVTVTSSGKPLSRGKPVYFGKCLLRNQCLMPGDQSHPTNRPIIKTQSQLLWTLSLWLSLPLRPFTMGARLLYETKLLHCLQIAATLLRQTRALICRQLAVPEDYLLLHHLVALRVLRLTKSER